MDAPATPVNGKLTNLNRVSNWTAVEYGILECPETGFLPAVRFPMAGPANWAGQPVESGTADYDFYQLKRLTICNTRDVFVPVKAVTS